MQDKRLKSGGILFTNVRIKIIGGKMEIRKGEATVR